MFLEFVLIRSLFVFIKRELLPMLFMFVMTSAEVSLIWTEFAAMLTMFVEILALAATNYFDI